MEGRLRPELLTHVHQLLAATGNSASDPPCPPFVLFSPPPPCPRSLVSYLWRGEASSAERVPEADEQGSLRAEAERRYKRMKKTELVAVSALGPTRRASRQHESPLTGAVI